MAIYGGPLLNPRVTDVHIGSLPGGSGLAWSGVFLNYLRDIGVGSDSLGYKIPVGVASSNGITRTYGQLDYMPWMNVNCISLSFNQDVNINSSSLSITGINRTYSVNSLNYRYENGKYVASFFFSINNPPTSGTVVADKIRVNLNASGVSGKFVNAPLAGNITNATWTINGDSVTSTGSSLPSSGPNTNFSLLLNFGPGDLNNDRAVSSADLSIVSTRRETSTTSGNYNFMMDVGADGQIRSASQTPGVSPSEDDRGLIFLRRFSTAPTGII